MQRDGIFSPSVLFSGANYTFTFNATNSLVTLRDFRATDEAFKFWQWFYGLLGLGTCETNRSPIVAQ